MYVVGTAGHVDHGKSTLVRALTGIDPDRLKEEKAREMTIDLGFAWFALPELGTAGEIGVIDVPGHRDFIENMLAGVGGIDAVLFVVAADEGVMPQTREHLAIISLLGIPAGVIALTKTDLALDPDWIGLVQLDLGELTRGTPLENAPIVPVSARTGKGLPELRAALADVLRGRPPARDEGRPRLWVDRAFSVAGFGTVVTGTLIGGTLYVGQEVELTPGSLRARIRGLQSHQKTVESLGPGNRAAVNLSGVNRDQVRRGQLLTLPDLITPTILIDVQFRHLPEAARPLRHNTEVKVFSGSAESMGRARVLEGDSLPPGAEGWLQIELRSGLPLSKGDRVIVRLPSPGETIGGGVIVDPAPKRLWRRGRPEVIARLTALARGEPRDLVMQTLAGQNTPMQPDQIAKRTELDAETVQASLAACLEAGSVIALGEGWFVAQSSLAALAEQATKRLAAFHQHEGLRAGMRPETLRGALALSDGAFNAVLGYLRQAGHVVQTANGLIHLPGHQMRLSRAQQAAWSRLQAAFAAAPYTPPSYKDCVEMVGEDVIAALIEAGELRLVGAEVVFTLKAYRAIIDWIREDIATRGKTDVGSVRDRFQTSRKYALAVLEHLNALGITKRAGDGHLLASGAWEKAE